MLFMNKLVARRGEKCIASYTLHVHDVNYTMYSNIAVMYRRGQGAEIFLLPLRLFPSLEFLKIYCIPSWVLKHNNILNHGYYVHVINCDIITQSPVAIWQLSSATA